MISKGESEYGPANIGVNDGMKLQIDVFGRAGQSMVLGKGVYRIRCSLNKMFDGTRGSELRTSHNDGILSSMCTDFRAF